MQRQVQLGRSPGQPRLHASGESPKLGRGKEVLPALEKVADAPRPMWRHPAFLVSMILALLALIAAAIFAVAAIFGGGGAGRVSGASIDLASGNVHLSWQAEGAVELYVVTGDQVLDVTQFVIAEDEAWIPAGLGLYRRSSCFVIRPASQEPELREEVLLDSRSLAEQHAASVCVSDAEAAS